MDGLNGLSGREVGRRGLGLGWNTSGLAVGRRRGRSVVGSRCGGGSVTADSVVTGSGAADGRVTAGLPAGSSVNNWFGLAGDSVTSELDSIGGRGGNWPGRFGSIVSSVTGGSVSGVTGTRTVTATAGLGGASVTKTTGLRGVSSAMTLEMTDASVASSSGAEWPGNSTPGLWTASGSSGRDGVRPGPGNCTPGDVTGPMTSPVDCQLQWLSQLSQGIQAPPQALHGFTPGS